MATRRGEAEVFVLSYCPERMVWGRGDADEASMEWGGWLWLVVVCWLGLGGPSETVSSVMRSVGSRALAEFCRQAAQRPITTAGFQLLKAAATCAG